MHKVYKSVVPNTNKRNLQRDLTVFENEIQGLRFLADGHQDERYTTGPGSGLINFLRSGIIESFYVSRFEAEIDEDNLDLEGEHLFCSTNISKVSLRGKPWTISQIRERELPSSPLTNAQMGELTDAYKEYGDHTLNIIRTISYYEGVSYTIRGADERDGAGNWRDTRPANLVVNTGDILEVLDPDESSAFIRVLGVMKHDHLVFLVVAWLVPTHRLHRLHPQLGLPEYRQCPLFEYAGFFSLETVDHSRFINSSNFVSLGGDRYVRNEWVFNIL